MEKINNNSKKVEKNKKKNEHNKHNNKRLSVDKINSRFMNFIRKAKKPNNEQSMEDIKPIHINKSIKDGEQTEIKINKKEFLKNTSNLSSSKIEKDYYKDIIGKLKLSKKDKNNKSNNIKYKVVDYNIIINNNKTNYYCKGNNINNELAFTQDKNEIKNNKEYYVNNDIENISGSEKEFLSKNERKIDENKIYINKNIEQKNLAESQMDFNNNNQNIEKNKSAKLNNIENLNKSNIFEEKDINLKESKNNNIIRKKLKQK